MNAAGIDVSSRKSTVAVLRPLGEVVKLPFEVPHSAEGLALLAKQLKALESETRVVIEHTGATTNTLPTSFMKRGSTSARSIPCSLKHTAGTLCARLRLTKRTR